jgi:uncharacterized membrane protein YeiH
METDIAIKAFLVTLDLLGAFAFAVSGASAGIEKRLDIFGVLVLALVAATFGGIARDLLIGAIPPAAITNVYYLVTSLLAGIATFFWYPVIKRLQSPVLIFDAVGLSFFVVAGTQKALAFGIDPVMAAILGMLTGIGGGVMRDVLIAQVPAILRTDFYALAALAGASVVVIGDALRFPPEASAVAGGVLCLGLRLMAIRYGWRLPTGRPDQNSDPS